ncbi:transcriptional regulator [Sinorhizobium fredii]|uniref:transcriptional regulator n=1 Tax=Rhizobium fredii TaxID=380 RepID=UPI003514BC3A
MSEIDHITGRQLAAARTLTGLGQVELAALAHISAPTLRRMEASDGPLTGMANNIAAVIRVLYDQGVIFLDDGATTPGGPGVRLRSADRT